MFSEISSQFSLLQPAVIDVYIHWIAGGFAVLGLLAGYCKCQFGRPASKHEHTFNFIAAGLVIYLVAVGKWEYFALYLYFIIGEFLVAMYYRFARKNKYICANNTKPEICRIELGDEVLEYRLPRENNKNNEYKMRDFTDKQFEKSSENMPETKCIFNRAFYCFNGQGKEKGQLRVFVSLQKVPEFSSLADDSSLNAAAVWLYLARGNLPRKVTKLNSDSDTGKTYSVSDWALHNKNENRYISYTVSVDNSNGGYNSYENYYERYVHAAVNDSMMLTIKFDLDFDDMDVKKYMEEMLRQVQDSWSICNSNLDKPSQDVDEVVAVPGPSEVKPFDVKLPTEKQYRLDLRNHSEDPLEWIVFENSYGFYDWFKTQMVIICAQYNQKVDDYILNLLNNCLALKDDVVGNSVSDIEPKKKIV